MARLLLVLALLVPASALAVAARPGQAQSGDLVGEIGQYVIAGDETLLDLARRFDLGYVELLAANPGLDPWVPPPGASILLPTAHVLPRAARRGVVVNLGDQRLYHFARDGSLQASYPIGLGAEGWDTPLGVTTIVRKRANPTWRPPPSIRAERPDLPEAVPPGPDNPMGAYALDLGWTSYAIHGTNQPYAIGRRVTHGCIRLYPEDIERLFAAVQPGLRVEVVNQPVKFGWRDGDLYLEAHPSLAQLDAIEAGAPPQPEEAPGAIDQLIEELGGLAYRLDVELAERVLRERRGVPVRVTF